MSYVLRRGGAAIIVLLLAITLNFAMIRAAPGEYRNRVADQTGAALTEQQRQQLRKSYGLDESVPMQFVRYVAQTFTGNFGRSFADGEPVGQKLWGATKNTLRLVIAGVLIGILFGVALGTIAGSTHRKWLDVSIVGVASIVYSLPAQWIGMVLLTLLVGTFPVGGMEDPFATGTGFWAHQTDVLHHMALPSLTLGLVTFGAYVLVTRSAVVQVMGEDFMVTARAKGYSHWRILSREVLRNASLPVVALAAISLGSILGGALLIEVVFSWPGLGSMAFNAITARDYPVIQATFLVFTIGVVALNFTADCLYSVLDPRVRQT